MAMTTASVPSEFPKKNGHGSKRCQECPILTSVHSSQRGVTVSQIAQALLNTSNIHFYFSTNPVCRKGVSSCSKNMTLAIVDEYFYRSCILQYLSHVLPFNLSPFARISQLSTKQSFRWKVQGNKTFQVRIYLKRDTARRSDHEQNQTGHHSKIKLFHHGRPLSRAVRTDLTALWSTHPGVCKKVISYCLQKLLYVSPNAVHFIFKSSVHASRKDSC